MKRFPAGYSRSIRQQNFESPRSRGFGHRFDAVGQLVFARDQRLDVHPAGFEQPERGFKTPAARPDHADFINDYPGSVESDRAAKSGLQDNRAARPDQIERDSIPPDEPLASTTKSKRDCGANSVRVEFSCFDSGARRKFQLGVSVCRSESGRTQSPRSRAKSIVPVCRRRRRRRGVKRGSRPGQGSRARRPAAR